MFQIKIPRKHQKLFLQIYKMTQFTFESLCMIYYLRYMMGRSETHSLPLMLSGITLVYFHEKSQNNIHWRTTLREMMSGNWRWLKNKPSIISITFMCSNLQCNQFIFFLERSCIGLLSKTQSFFGRSLELCAFFIQFLNWWHSEQLHAKFFAFPIPSAPQPQVIYENSSTIVSRT